MMKTIKIEVLYPQMNDLYGDNGNIAYLCKKIEMMGAEVTVIRTGMQDVPAFTREKVDVLYIGPCTENQQEYQARLLMPYRQALQARMEAGEVTLMTGNAFELLGDSVTKENGESFSCLGLLPMTARRFTRLRYNDLSLGYWNGIEIVGIKNQLSHSYLPAGERVDAFLQMEKGSGWNPDVRSEGYNKGFFFATYLLGPILPLNPPFAKVILQHLLPDVPVPTLPYEMEAYDRRTAEFRK